MKDVGLAPDSLVGAFIEAADNINEAFKVSDILRQHFVRTLDSAAKNPGLTNTQKVRIERASDALKNIKDASIARAETEVLATLYKFGIVSIVSVAEQLLKSTFNNLLTNNLERINKPDKFTVNLVDLKENNFETNKQFWADQIIVDLNGAKNAQEKLNFQNIKAIESLLATYFGIDLTEFPRYELVAQRVHVYYQIRHILSHNGGYIDSRFLHNLDVAGVVTEDYVEGEAVRIRKEDYDECREVFTTFFAFISVEIGAKGLALGTDLE